MEKKTQNKDSEIKVEEEFRFFFKRTICFKGQKPKICNKKEAGKECVAQRVGIVNKKHDTKTSITKPSNNKGGRKELNKGKKNFPIKQEN